MLAQLFNVLVLCQVSSSGFLVAMGAQGSTNDGFCGEQPDNPTIVRWSAQFAKRVYFLTWPGAHSWTRWFRWKDPCCSVDFQRFAMLPVSQSLAVALHQALKEGRRDPIACNFLVLVVCCVSVPFSHTKAHLSSPLHAGSRTCLTLV